jgi:hypothetical protein
MVDLHEKAPRPVRHDEGRRATGGGFARLENYYEKFCVHAVSLACGDGVVKS